MKTVKITSVLVSLILLTFGACTKDLSEINENPNNVSETHPQLLLTEIAFDAFKVEGTGSMYASRMLVQTDGENNGQYYNWNRGSFEPYDELRNITKMYEEAVRIESNTYIAIAKFFRAYYFYGLTITFGDVPYSEALQGETANIYEPVYDTQKQVFQGILQELEEANTLLSGSTELVAGDIIYNGDAAKWQKLINSFRLKVLISLSKKEGDADLNIPATFASIFNSQPIMTSLEDNGQLVFVDQDGSRYSQFNSSSYGSGMYMDSTFIQRLQDHKDPRLFLYCSTTKNAKEAGLLDNDFSAYEGGNPIAPYGEVNDKAAAGDASKVNNRYTNDPVAEPHNLLGFWEVEFVIAEAASRGWISADAKEHYENGIKTNFSFYQSYAKDATGTSDYSSFVNESAADAYLLENLVNWDNATSSEEQLELIITQKYFTSFHQSGWRMYFDQLRTGYPEFMIPAAGTPPTRWIYPQDEYNQNAANVSTAIERQFGADNDGIRQVPWWLQ
ncbi:SusD/RagB family nutrient-binding outer membrane lipoprotein [Aurantibacter crassamenti]|uniref:SusD/RagB family nutrient-binding outer membrane lipoprotein n=1 Tax=Aurantibacter crassamenti TaxID=1837375 RepID=UPI0019399B2F|nr:SusD/RagB family nutrient-binding outer membrane lipoprotein [Aurantibacter crassamenti]MBM1105083.1 SusD/RagB family nutrient-binding outer membrane lipoprotein [Aurantibacter crassamenti]